MKKDLAPTWKATPLANRLNDCRRGLYLHNLLSESQNEDIKRKLLKWVAKGRYP